METLGSPMPNLRDLAVKAQEEGKPLSPLAGRFLLEITREDGELRCSRPRRSGKGDYVWRMVAWQISPKPIHQHLPMGAPFYLTEGDYETWRELQGLLDDLVDEIVALVPKNKWWGVQRWAGLIG